MTRITIVRHGNTFELGETPRRIGRRTDLPLTQAGRAQARALAAHFAEMRWSRILCSPLRRTRETAALIATGQPIETADWLAEIDHGPDEDRTEAEVLARIGQAALDRWEQDAVPPPGWTIDAEARLAGWRTLFASGGEVIAVTSNGAARFALIAAGAAPARLRTGAWGRILVVDGRATVECWDQRPPTLRPDAG